MKNYTNWRTEIDAQNILWLYLDKQDSSANSINPLILNELEMILDDIAEEPKYMGIVFASAKKSGFIAGADISNFKNLEDPQEARAFIERGQFIFKRISELQIPTVAMIQGFCLGGGLELALACRYRIAENSSKTRIGLPEVLLGIQPGWGGTFRLPALTGAIEALKMMMSGKIVDARTAYKLGIVDAEVPERQLKRAVIQTILSKPEPRNLPFYNKALNYAFVRNLLGKWMQRQLAKKVKPQHYPAPFAILNNWVKYGIDLPLAMEKEMDSIVNLVTTDTAKQLIRVYYLKERMKSLAKGADFKAKHVHVIGAGTMGGDIAAWCALKGLTVTLQDREPKYIAPAIARAHHLFKGKLKQERLINEAMDRLRPDVQGYGIEKADVIIEAIYENLEAKQSLLKQIEAKAKPEAIIASNTSSIPLDEMNGVMQKPERLVGIHYFNPVAKMELVEVVHGRQTSERVLKSALAFVRQIDKLPLPVTGTPGFLVNRVLTPYLLEAVELLEEGVPAEVIDKLAVDFGMPMGPVELADTVGLDICLSVGQNLAQHFKLNIPERLKQMVSEGKLGRKTGDGFYRYSKNQKPQKILPKDYNASPDITDRLILRMLNEAMACMREKVVADYDLLDAGMIFGTGFAPFRGGPIQYMQMHGIEKLKGRLEQLKVQYGPRFTPDMAWETKKDKKETQDLSSAIVE